MSEHQQTQKSTESKSTSQKQATPQIQAPISHPMAIVQRARMNPKSLTPADILQLQRTIGNRAVGRLLSEIRSSSTAQKAPVQRQEIPKEEETCPSCMQRQEIPEEEEPLQGKFETIQRLEPEEEEKLQMKSVVQRQEIPDEDEPIQGKMIGTVQRQETQDEEPLQKKIENNTGMPDNLKAGVESLSGIDMSDVRVHYNSSKPAEVGALAYTQGTNIHVAPGQEKHLPHEAWHVVQQAQGLVKPTMQLKHGVPVNDDEGLEHEADVMGERAFTSGQDVFFRQGAYEPGSWRGKELIAHELTHVVQQNRRALIRSPLPHQQLPQHPASETPSASSIDNQTAQYQLTGSVEAPFQVIAHSTYHSNIIQRKTYLELNDSQQEVVDLYVRKEYESASEKFEMLIGKMASEDPRSQKVADELVERTTLLVETMFFNTNKQQDTELDKYYGEIFGIGGRPDIAGSVGSNIDFIQEVFQEGSFREKMTLFYVALAERQTLNKMLLQYNALLKKEVEVYGKGGAKEDMGYEGKLTELQGLGAYVDKKSKRAYLTQALKWVQTEIDLERQADLKALEIGEEHLDTEQMKEREEQDQALAAQIVQIVNPEGLTGKELEESKCKQYKDLVTVFMRLKAGSVNEKLQNPIAFKEYLDKINDEKKKYESLLADHAKKYSDGFGRLNVLMNEVYADEEERIIKDIRKAASEEDVDPLDMIAFFKKNVAEDVLGDLREKLKDKIGRELPKLPDTQLKKYLSDKLHKSVLKLSAWAKELHTQKEDTSGKNIPDDTAEKLAETRFGIELFGSSLFHNKKEVEESRRGGARVMAPGKEQNSDQTPKKLEEEEYTRMSYRELAAAFYTNDEFAKLLDEFKKQKSKKDTDSLSLVDKEELRKEMLKKHGDTKLPWKPGMKVWKIDIKSPFYEAAEILQVKIGATVSGSADRVMRGAKYLGFDTKELRDVLLACLGWMIPLRDHTYYEIMKAGEPYVDLAPPKNPFKDLAIDVDYGFGRGYAKMLTFFERRFNPQEIPDYLFSLPYKDHIAEKLFSTTSESDQEDREKSNLKIISSMEGKALHTGETVKYSVRNNKEEPFRYEWFWLRQGGFQGRASMGSLKNEFTTDWKYKGIYKIYCLVYPTKDQSSELPVATLRYDQVVYSEEPSSESQVNESSAKPGEGQVVSAKVMFTSLKGEMREIPIKVKLLTVGSLWVSRIDVPVDLSKPEGGTQIFNGKAQKSNRLCGDSDVISTFNQIFRKDIPPATAQSEAVYDAVKSWGNKQQYAETGSLNIDIFDTKTHVILKEHFIYTDQFVNNIKEDFSVPSFRIQGGDFTAGIYSHVRLVNTREGRLDISGNAMVWINFGDKGRMVWWLNNRSDRSYSINFSVTSRLLKTIAKYAVHEKQANVSVNVGKPIISADKATHQYAISKEGNRGVYANFDQLKAAALGHVAKMFQWKTFDIASVEESGIMPKGVGKLASGFNEELRKAKDLEIKIRLLKAMGEEESRISELEAQYKILNENGQKTWKSDFIYNLRKPGESDIDKKDRRTVKELSEDELFKERHKLAAKIIKDLDLQKVVGQMIAKSVKKLDEISEYKERKSDEKQYYTKIRKAAIDAMKPFLEELKGKIKDDNDLLAKLQDFPEQFGQNVVTLAVNKEISRILRKKSELIKSLPDDEKEKLLKTLAFSYKGNSSKTFDSPSTVDIGDSPSKSDKSSGSSGSSKDSGKSTKYSTSTKIHKLVAIDPKEIQTEGFEVVKAKAKEGGIINAGNTCYLASVMQMVAYSHQYSQIFLSQANNDALSPARKAVIRLGSQIVNALLGGNTVPCDLIHNFRAALIAEGWTQGSGDEIGSQQDAAMFMRWLMEDFFHSASGIRERHDWVKIGHYSRTAERIENVVKVGGLAQSRVNKGRSLQDLVKDIFSTTQTEQELDGNPIRHRYRVLELPQELTLHLLRYDFNRVLRTYTPNYEVIAVDNDLIFRGELSPEEEKVYTYSLQSFVVHIGASPSGGHYVTYFRKDNNWYCANDDKVTQVSNEDAVIARSEGYIYHFVKINEETIRLPLFSNPRQEREMIRLREDPVYYLEFMYKKALENKDSPNKIRNFLRLSKKETRKFIKEFLEKQLPYMSEDSQNFAKQIIDILIEISLDDREAPHIKS